MKSVLVTGANGFIGSHLTERLVAGGLKVRCLVRPESDLRWLEGLPVTLVRGDLMETDTLVQAAKGVDTVFHLAGRVKSPDDEGFYKANVVGTVNLLKAVAQAAPKLNRFVYVSSQAAVGPSPGGRLLSEDDPCHPITPYGASKLAAEEAIQAFRTQVPITIIRPSVVGGPRDVDLLEVFKLVKGGLKVQLGWRMRYGSYIEVSDLVEGMILAASHADAVGEIFFLVAEEEVPVARLQEAIAQALNRRALPVRVPFGLLTAVALVNDVAHRMADRESLVSLNKVRELRQSHWTCSGEKARRVLGFSPKVDVETAMEKAARWYQAQGWL